MHTPAAKRPPMGIAALSYCQSPRLQRRRRRLSGVGARWLAPCQLATDLKISTITINMSQYRFSHETARTQIYISDPRTVAGAGIFPISYVTSVAGESNSLTTVVGRDREHRRYKLTVTRAITQTPAPTAIPAMAPIESPGLLPSSRPLSESSATASPSEGFAVGRPEAGGGLGEIRHSRER